MSKSPQIQEFIDNMARLTFGAAPSDVPGHCIACRDPFTDKNVYSELGRKETKISGICERCFDDMFKEQDDEQM